MKNTSSPYLFSLDGLRAVSILLVVVSHFGFGSIVPGGLGVTLFFFISGYIITSILLREYEKSATLDIKAFYIRRFLRLTPALYGYVLFAVLISLWVGLKMYWMDVGATLLYITNYWEIFHGFGVEGELSPFSITWSLAIEEHFYIFYPALLLLLLKFRYRPETILTLIIFIVLGWRLWLAVGIGLDHIQPDRIYKGSDTRIDSILFGALFAVLYKKNAAYRQIMHNQGSFILGIVLLLGTLLYRDEIFRETWRYSIQGIAITLFFAPIVLGEGRIARFLATAPMVYIGKISYSLYLYHWLIVCCRPLLFPDPPLYITFPIEVALSVLLAHLSYQYVERLGRDYKSGWVRS